MSRMITLEDIKALRKEQFEKSLALIDKKGHDYNRSQQEAGDTLFNLRVAAMLGIVDSPAKSVLVRMVDKVMRMISLADADPAVKGESIEDTVTDLHNYADYYLAFKREEAKEKIAAASAQAFAQVYTDEVKYCSGSCHTVNVEKEGGH